MFTAKRKYFLNQRLCVCDENFLGHDLCDDERPFFSLTRKRHSFNYLINISYVSFRGFEFSSFEKSKLRKQCGFLRLIFTQSSSSLQTFLKVIDCSRFPKNRLKKNSCALIIKHQTDRYFRDSLLAFGNTFEENSRSRLCAVCRVICV